MRESERLRAKAEKIEAVARAALSEAEQRAYQDIAESYRQLAAEAEASEPRQRGDGSVADGLDALTAWRTSTS